MPKHEALIETVREILADALISFCYKRGGSIYQVDPAILVSDFIGSQSIWQLAEKKRTADRDRHAREVGKTNSLLG